MNLKCIVLFLLFISNINSDKQSGNNFVFELADLTVDYETPNGWVNLEAFKSSSNDLILQNNEVSKFGQLNWLSIGNPQLTLHQNDKLFKFKPEGFDIRVDMLNNDQREFLKNTVKKKFNIGVSADQIVTLVPEKFECFVQFTYNSERILLKGKAKQLNKIPLTLFFNAPEKSKERIAFEQRIKNQENNADLDFECEITSFGQTYKKNVLSISADQIDKLKLIDNIFGPADSVYVTRKQLSSLSSELYAKLNIIEEYQIPEHEFSAKFVNDFIKQTSTFVSKPVPLDEAIKSMSPYDFQKDLQADTIKKELSKVFKIDSKGSKSNLIVNKTWYEHLKTKSKTDIHVDAEVDIIDLVGGSGSVDYVEDKSRNWAKSGSSFDDQLRELNSYDESDVQWERNGEIIIPKSIKVTRLSKASFKKNLVFNRIRKEFSDSQFKRSFVLSTSDNLYASSFSKENIDKLNQLKDDVKNLNDLLKISEKNLTLQIDLVQDLGKANLNNALIKITEVQNLLKTKITSCRLCFQETENGSGKCQGSRSSCTDYTSSPFSAQSWTAPFRHDSGLKVNHQHSANGGCTYQWSIQCIY